MTIYTHIYIYGVYIYMYIYIHYIHICVCVCYLHTISTPLDIYMEPSGDFSHFPTASSGVLSHLWNWPGIGRDTQAQENGLPCRAWVEVTCSLDTARPRTVLNTVIELSCSLKKGPTYDSYRLGL